MKCIINNIYVTYTYFYSYESCIISHNKVYFLRIKMSTGLLNYRKI